MVCSPVVYVDDPEMQSCCTWSPRQEVRECMAITCAGKYPQKPCARGRKRTGDFAFFLRILTHTGLRRETTSMRACLELNPFADIWAAMDHRREDSSGGRVKLIGASWKASTD